MWFSPKGYSSIGVSSIVIFHHFELPIGLAMPELGSHAILFSPIPAQPPRQEPGTVADSEF
jgi:hypothetical protein